MKCIKYKRYELVVEVSTIHTSNSTTAVNFLSSLESTLRKCMYSNDVLILESLVIKSRRSSICGNLFKYFLNNYI